MAMNLKTILIPIITFVLIIMLFPMVQNAINEQDFSGWTFAGASSVEQFLTSIPLLLIVVSLGSFVYLFFRRVTS